MAFAREMVSVTISWAMVRAVLIPVAACDVAVRREWRSWLRCVMAGRSASLEWYNYPLSTDINLVAVSVDDFRINSL